MSVSGRCLRHCDRSPRRASVCCVKPENEVEISLAIRPGANVVQVYGFCIDAPDGKLRIVLELCAHGSLRSHLQSLPRDKVLHWGRGHEGRTRLSVRSSLGVGRDDAIGFMVRVCVRCPVVIPGLCGAVGASADVAVFAQHLRSTDQWT